MGDGARVDALEQDGAQVIALGAVGARGWLNFLVYSSANCRWPDRTGRTGWRRLAGLLTNSGPGAVGADERRR